MSKSNIFNAMSPKEVHDQSVVSLLVAGTLAFIFGLVLWFVSVNKVDQTPVFVTDTNNSLRLEVAALLENAKTQATQAETSRVAATLSNTKVEVSSEERARVASVLENI